ncbi:lipid II:glycine glycyltransferase FemX [Verrucosispora sp. WMMD703]|uniref:lipid II:glycine glycyltransferase FemX n=1 Tax=unclassified Micromonospora TaxID=2617518 RepID=UPI002499CFD9|nr:GNAT family N-acetyltransferase [Verrucosispora sp. WMMD1129]WFE43947.1 GNAT family N-acetyltransferase [Verrucosispora sp. WMMD1129]
MKLEIWNARHPRDTARWEKVHAAWPDREVCAHPGYVRLFAREQDEPLAAYARTRDGFILYPFLLRPVDATHLRDDPLSHDITSPYGGSGGAFQQNVDEVEAKAFWISFDKYCHSRRVVSEFCRLHIYPEQILPHPGNVQPRLTNVVRNLDTPPEQMWMEFEHKVRKNVNKARRNGVVVEVDETGDRLNDFLRIYETTMRRRGAGELYHFPRDFFETLLRDLPGQAIFFHAQHQGRVISTELVLISSRNMYSFLGGTDEEAFDLRPNDLLKYEIFRWGHHHGQRRFLLGGGYAPDDGIFRYKKSFAPQNLLTFSTGSRVLDQSRYDALTQAHIAEARRRDPGWSPQPDFFPEYRQPLPQT